MKLFTSLKLLIHLHYVVFTKWDLFPQGVNEEAGLLLWSWVVIEVIKCNKTST